jgi:hypothetical protein
VLKRYCLQRWNIASIVHIEQLQSVAHDKIIDLCLVGWYLIPLCLKFGEKGDKFT